MTELLKGIRTVVGATVAVSSRPIVLGWLGFTAGGIAAAITSSMKSRAAIANGGRVAVNSLVSKLQSTGAKGPDTSTYVILGVAGLVLGVWIVRLGRGDTRPSY